MGARQIKAGAAFVELGARDRLSGALKRIAGRFKSFGLAVGRVGLMLGGAVVAGATVAVKAFTNMGEQLNDLSGRTGMTVEGLSELKFAAEQSGASMDTLEAASRRMSKTIADAAGGSKEATKALAALGLTAADLEKLTPDKQFRLIAQRLAAIEDPAQRVASAMQVFGRGGAALLPMVRDLEALSKRFRELGLVMSTEDAKAADDLGDKFGELWAVLKQGVFVIGAALAPAITRFVDTLESAAVAVVNVFKENRGSITAWANTVGSIAVWLGTQFQRMAGLARDGLDALSGGAFSSLLVGDFDIAGQLAVNALKGHFLTLKDWMGDLWRDIGDGLVAAQIRAVAEVKKLWASLPSFIERARNFVGDSDVIKGIKTQQTIAQTQLEHMQKKPSNEFTQILVRAAQARVKELELQMQDALKQEMLGREVDPVTQARVAVIDDEMRKNLAAAQSASAGGANTQAEKDTLAEQRKVLEAQRALLQAVRPVSDIGGFLSNLAGGGGGAAGLPLPPDEDDIADAVGDAIGKSFGSSRGTFNAAAAGGLAGADQIDKDMLSATKSIEKHTRDMAKKKGLVYTT